MNTEVGLLTIFFFLVSWNIIYGVKSYRQPQRLKLKNWSCDLGNVISICLIVLLVFLVVHDHDNPDYSGYFRRYYNPTLLGSIDWGYEQIMNLGGDSGLAMMLSAALFTVSPTCSHGLPLADLGLTET